GHAGHGSLGGGEEDARLPVTVPELADAEGKEGEPARIGELDALDACQVFELLEAAQSLLELPELLTPAALVGLGLLFGGSPRYFEPHADRVEGREHGRRERDRIEPVVRLGTQEELELLSGVHGALEEEERGAQIFPA